jgi:hypothetical protein
VRKLNRSIHHSPFPAQIRRLLVCLICCWVLLPQLASAQDRQRAGKSIGKVSTEGNLIVLELADGILGREHLFDLTGRTLRFSVAGTGYRVENLSLDWDSDFGTEIKSPEVTLHNFQFPFSGKKWDSLSVGANGSIRFGEPEREGGAARRDAPGPGGRFGGASIGRFDQLSEAAGTLINTVSAICVFLKPRLSGPRYVKELPDRAVVTWDVTEPWGNIQDFTWTKTINRFQAVLFRDGTIEMSYKEVAAKDAIVGVFPFVNNETERSVATLTSKQRSGASGYLDLRKVTIASVGGVILKVNLETGAPALKEGDANLAGIAYRVHFKPRGERTQDSAESDVVWTVRGFAPRQGGGTPRYLAFGPGLSRSVKASGNTISIQGILPKALRGIAQVEVSAEAFASGNPSAPVSQVAATPVKLSSVRSPEVELSKLKQGDGPFAIVYESFHYFELPNPRDLTCSVIKALGDKFDFLPYYSDFRVDNQEAGTPSNGPRGGNVTGIGTKQGDLESYCSQGRFQWQFIQPVYVGANQMQERPPEGAPVGNDHDITFYTHQIGERTPEGKLLPYDYAMSQIGHEMGHRWGADATAKVNGETIELGPVHWTRGLQAPVAFPFQRPVEASAMGGSVWQDNLDGTFTQLDDDYYVPATGWSYLDLYLMGMISASEVPDFFILRNLTPAGKDANGHPIFKADRTKITIQDVIAAEGPRRPDVDHAQKNFNTGFVMVVQHGETPSKELIERTNGIRTAWMDYWATTTGHRSTMTADPR